MNFCTYLHTRNDTGAVFYVGKGIRNRALSERNRNKHWHNIVKKHGHSVVMVEHFDDEQDAFAMERYLIASYRALSIPLCNLTDGGEGVTGHVHSAETRKKMSGRLCSEEARARMSAAQTGKKHGPHSEEWCAKLRIASTGNTRALGYRHTPEALAKLTGRNISVETRAKISALHKGKPLSEEHRAKCSRGQKGKHHSDEVKAKMSASQKAIPMDVRLRMNKANSERGFTPDGLRRLSEASKGRLVSDATKAKMSESAQHRSEEYRLKLSAAASRDWQKRKAVKQAAANQPTQGAQA